MFIWIEQVLTVWREFSTYRPVNAEPLESTKPGVNIIHPALCCPLHMAEVLHIPIPNLLPSYLQCTTVLGLGLPQKHAYY